MVGATRRVLAGPASLTVDRTQKYFDIFHHDVGQILCVSRVSRYAGGASPLLKHGGSYVVPHDPLDPATARQTSAIPSTNTMRFAVTMSYSEPRCLSCGITAPSEEAPGGDLECTAVVEGSDQCVVTDQRTGVQWTGPCDRLVGRAAPPTGAPAGLWLGIGVGAVALIALALLAGAGGARAR